MPLIGSLGAASIKSHGGLMRKNGMISGTILRFINNSGTYAQQMRSYNDASNRVGPVQNQLDSAYIGTPLYGAVSMSNGFQKWTVPADFTGRINAYGANGGKEGYNRGQGRGAYLQYTFDFKQGDIIVAGVGQGGAWQPTTHSSDGGGGGTGIAISRNPGGDAASYSVNPGWLGLIVYPLIIAGGGAGESSDQAGRDGSTTRAANSVSGGGVGPGGGWSSDATVSYTGAGASFVNGGIGGALAAAYASGSNISGGFGMGGGGSTTSATHNDSAGGGGWVGGSSNSSGPSGGGSYLFTGDGNGFVGYNNAGYSYDGLLYIEVL